MCLMSDALSERAVRGRLPQRLRKTSPEHGGLRELRLLYF